MGIRLLVAFAVVVLPLSLSAGVFEIGVSGSYRTNTIDDNKSVSKSIRSSVAYYFLSMSAIEASFTNGLSEQETIDYESQTSFQLIGLDFVLSLAEKKASFRPYLKVGGVYLVRSIIYKQVGFSKEVYEDEGLAPSAGAGLRIILTKNFALKFGGDAWTSPLDAEKKTYDYAARAGISWVF
jgi:drug/metabolite transporter superfamily protein YnfA